MRTPDHPPALSQLPIQPPGPPLLATAKAQSQLTVAATIT